MYIYIYTYMYVYIFKVAGCIISVNFTEIELLHWNTDSARFFF